MKLRSIIIGASALALMATASMPAMAAGSSGNEIILAQSGDSGYRVIELEEQVRRLNGRIEDLTFQLLQMQEQIRKMQEDNEFRFQELEERGDAGGSNKSINDLLKKSGKNGGKSLPEKPLPSERTANTDRLDGQETTSSSSTPKKTIDGVEIYDGPSGVDTRKPGTLGSQIYDADGNIILEPTGKPIDLTTNFTSQGTSAADLPEQPDSLYQLGYDYIQSGDYALAEDVFVAFKQRHSNHQRIADVNFWLAESHFARGEYDHAAEIFLETNTKWPDSRLAPQALLKLGISLIGLNQRELACATYSKVKQKYPNSSKVIKNSVATEQKAARCLN